MKTRTFSKIAGFAAILITAFSLSASAAIQSGTGEPKLHQFKFRMKGETFEFSQKTVSYEEAFERAAKACYQHFKDGRRLTENEGLDIIDVCANPRSI